MKTLKESLLGDIEANMTKGKEVEEDIIKEQILNFILTSRVYEYNNFTASDKLFKIYKKRNKWYVDVKSYITCYCTEDGHITDGTFSFGTVKGNFIVTSKDDNTQCPCISLNGCPERVEGAFYVMNSPNLKDLKGCPKNVFYEVSIQNTGITTLKYFPVNATTVTITDNKDLKTLNKAGRCYIDTQIQIWNNGVPFTKGDIVKMPWEIRNAKTYNSIICDK